LKDLTDYSDGAKTVITWLLLPPIGGAIALVGLGIGALFGEAQLGGFWGLTAGFLFWIGATVHMWFGD
jgi:hypothetical protein